MDAPDVSETGLRMQHLQRLLSSSKKLLLTGRDDEGDQVVLTSDGELQDLLKLSFEAHSMVLHLRLSVAGITIQDDSGASYIRDADNGDAPNEQSRYSGMKSLTQSMSEHVQAPIFSALCLGVLASVAWVCLKAKKST